MSQRLTGCMADTDQRGGRIGHLDPTRDTTPGHQDWEAIAFVLAILAVTALVVAIVVAQMWHAGLGLTGVAICATIIFVWRCQR